MKQEPEISSEQKTDAKLSSQCRCQSLKLFQIKEALGKCHYPSVHSISQSAEISSMWKSQLEQHSKTAGRISRWIVATLLHVMKQ